MGHGNTVDRWLESSDHFEARTLTGSGLFALLKFFYVRKESISHRICLDQQYGRRDVMWIFATWSRCMWSHKSTPLFLWTQSKITPVHAMIKDILLNIVFFAAFSLNASFLCVSVIEVIFWTGNFNQKFFSTCCAFGMNDDFCSLYSRFSHF